MKCAVRWLRANAEKYKIDPDHIGVLGYSAGGHLALMLGLTEPSDGLEGDGGNVGYSSRVQAVVSLAGPAELSIIPPGNESVAFYLKHLLGGTLKQVPEQYEKASPLTYVRRDRDNPPILTINGDNDKDVPLEQAEHLDAKMKDAGASHTLIVKKGVGHENLYVGSAAWDFFDRYLKVGAQ